MYKQTFNSRVPLTICCFVILTLVFATYYNSTFSNEFKSDCCRDFTSECWACQRGETLDEFCAGSPGKFGCPELLSDQCCSDQRKKCLACMTHMTTEEFCKINPGHYQCVTTKKIPDCCDDITKECLSCISQVSVDEFCKRHPGKFGCVAEIMVGIILTPQIGYTEFTSSVWQEYHGINDSQIHLFTDSSTGMGRDDLKNIYGEKVRVISTIGSSRDDKIQNVLDYFVSSHYKTLLLANVETIFSKNWKTFIQNNIHDKTDGFLSLYHSSIMHNYTVDCENMNGDLCIGGGNDIGFYGVAVTHKLTEKILKSQNEPFLNFNWESELNGVNARIMYPPKSLSMQIGLTNQTKDKCGQNEVAYRFNRCEFPDWIKNGIEYYFDRCTSPDESYNRLDSMTAIEKEGRFWTRPVISYCLYGKSRRYTQIALENARRVFSIYPEWKIWIYTDGTVPEPVMKELCEFDIKFIDMSQSKIQSKMSWRFLVASEPVKMYAIRDVDSWLLPRGKAAVDEWISSGRKFHVLRDHPNHSRYPMSGGMWGGLHDAIPNMRELLESRKMGDSYMTDMNFLNNVIWSIASKSVWAHDSYSLHKFGEDHPFPTELKGEKLFVGNVVLWPPPKD